jgi:hypothetical protein
MAAAHCSMSSLHWTAYFWPVFHTLFFFFSYLESLGDNAGLCKEFEDHKLDRHTLDSHFPFAMATRPGEQTKGGDPIFPSKSKQLRR